MTFDIITIVGAVVTAISYLAYRYCRENVYLTYKEQRSWEGEK